MIARAEDCPRCLALLGRIPVQPYAAPAHPSHVKSTPPGWCTGLLCPVPPREERERVNE